MRANEKSSELKDIDAWRVRLVHVMMTVAAVLFPVSMAVTFPVFLRDGHYQLMVADVACWLFVLYRRFVRSASYRTLSLTALIVVYVLSVSYLVALGPTYARGGWLVAFVVIGSFLLGVRAAVVLTGVNLVTLAGMYAFMSAIHPEWLALHRVTPLEWLMFTVNISGIAIGCGLPVGYLLSGLDRSLREERAARNEERAARQRLEEALEKLRAEVESREKLEANLRRTQKLEAIGRLASGIAHDLNNILVPVLTYAQLARRMPGQSEKACEYLDRILQAGHRAKELVLQILIFGREIEKPKDLMKPRETLMELISRLDLPESVELVTKIEPTDESIRGNRTELLQVLANLTSNALAAMEHGGGRLGLSLYVDRQGPSDSGAFFRASSRNGWICIQVSDTGCGMDEETAARAFDPFFTTKELGKGTGLGLAITDGIISAYGGVVDFDTQPSRGTTFRVFLPIVPEGEERHPHAPLKDSSEHELKGTVLLVDDEPEAREAIRQQLESLGWEVQAVDSAKAALRLLEAAEAHYDILLTDIRLPKVDGLTLAIEVKEQFPQMGLVLTSGYPDPQMTETACAHGIRSIVAKPFSASDLKRAIAEAVAHARERPSSRLAGRNHR